MLIPPNLLSISDISFTEIKSSTSNLRGPLGKTIPTGFIQY
jgi:hypothetical protein